MEGNVENRMPLISQMQKVLERNNHFIILMNTAVSLSIIVQVSKNGDVNMRNQNDILVDVVLVVVVVVVVVVARVACYIKVPVA